MSRCRLVAPEVVRLELSDGDYVTVKKTLNAGEYRKLLYDQAKDTPDGERLVLDPSKVGISKLLAYLIGWSFVGFGDVPIAYAFDQPEDLRRATLDNLDQATYRELIAAVTAHEKAQEQVDDAKKNGQAIAPAS